MKGSFSIRLVSPLVIAVLLLAGCNPRPMAEPTTQASDVATLTPTVAATITSTLTPTIIPIETVSTSVAPAGTPSPTPVETAEPSAPLTAVVTATTAFDTEGWVEHRLEEAGAQVSLPPDWILMRLSLAGYFARPNWVQNQTDPAAFALLIGIQGDVPYDLPGLTETQAYRLGENEPGPLTHEPIRLAGYEGVAFWDFAYVCMEAFVPADGVVHAVTVTPYLCQGEGADRHLKPEAIAMLESIRFFPPNPPPPDGLPVGGLPTPDE